jgi:concanavalin A-like lectin/glucanase superfamily protein
VQLDGLLGHWPLEGDARDVTDGGHHGEARGVVFERVEGRPAARFDGVGACMEVPHASPLQVGERDFSVALWVHTESALRDTLGDLVSAFDVGGRRGFHLGFQNFAGVTSGQSNHRDLQFGIDAGVATGAWRDCGRPGKSVMIWSLCVHEGALYAGTFEAGKDERGHVHRFDGGDNWEDCGSPDASNAVTALAVHEGALYAATGHYRSGGSALPDAENETHGGRVFRYEGESTWRDCGRLDECEAVFGLVSFGSALYATSMYSPGLHRWDGATGWEDCGHPGGRVGAMTAFNGYLYAGGYDADYGGVHRFDGESWFNCGGPPDTTQTYSFMQYGGDLYVGTWPTGSVFRYGGDTTWHHAGRLGEEQEVMGMAVYNGKLYAGTLPLASVYRYDGDGVWADTGRVDHTPDVKYRRAWSMAVFNGRLYCGTLPSGHVHSLEAGKVATHDRALASGWRHVAAVRRGGMLQLYVDGGLAAESTPFNPGDYNLANEEALRIGCGPHDYFNGALCDVRFYGRALGAREILALASKEQ